MEHAIAIQNLRAEHDQCRRIRVSNRAAQEVGQLELPFEERHGSKLCSLQRFTNEAELLTALMNCSSINEFVDQSKENEEAASILMESSNIHKRPAIEDIKFLESSNEKLLNEIQESFKNEDWETFIEGAQVQLNEMTVKLSDTAPAEKWSQAAIKLRKDRDSIQAEEAIILEKIKKLKNGEICRLQNTLCQKREDFANSEKQLKIYENQINEYREKLSYMSGAFMDLNEPEALMEETNELFDQLSKEVALVESLSAFKPMEFNIETRELTLAPLAIDETSSSENKTTSSSSSSDNISSSSSSSADTSTTSSSSICPRIKCIILKWNEDGVIDLNQSKVRLSGSQLAAASEDDKEEKEINELLIPEIKRWKVFASQLRSLTAIEIASFIY